MRGNMRLLPGHKHSLLRLLARSEGGRRFARRSVPVDLMVGFRSTETGVAGSDTADSDAAD